MRRHLVLVSDFESGSIISGKSEYLVRFLKKRLDFMSRLARGDLIYLRKKGREVLGQFNAGKIILIEKLDVGDWKMVKEVRGLSLELTKAVFEEKVSENSIIIIVQIEKLEQFITSPIEIPKQRRKEWIVLEKVSK